jgi:hypothetical protein
MEFLRSFNKIAYCFVKLFLLLFVNNLWADVDMSLIIQPTFNNYKKNANFNTPVDIIPQSTKQIDTTFELKTDYKNIFFLGSVKNLYKEDQDLETKGHLNELYYNFNLANFDISLGKKIISWGVGYGFRPLDIYEDKSQLSTDQTNSYGEKQIAVDYFYDLSNVSFVVVNPFSEKEKGEDNKRSFAIRYFSSFDDFDIQSVLSYDDENKRKFGSGIVFIVTDGLSLHGSLLHSDKIYKDIHNGIVLNTSYPYVKKEYTNSLTFLYGGNWTIGDSHNFIFEYWFNDKTKSKEQWSDFFVITNLQQQLQDAPLYPQEAVNNNLAYSAQAMDDAYLVQKNIYIRYEYSPDLLKIQNSILYAPDDDGYIWTLSGKKDLNSYKIYAGVRYFDGKKDSVYYNIPLQSSYFFSLSLTF